MNYLFVLFLLTSAPSFASNTKEPFLIQTIAGDEINGAMVNSTLLIGDHEVFLVDAQETVNNAKRVVAAIRNTHKELTTVFFTHSHADHILGAAVIKESFPKAKFIAIQKVATDISQNGEKLRFLFTKILADSKAVDKIASSVVIPEALQPKDEFIFDGKKLQIIEVNPGESESAAMIYIPESGTLISGDVLYNKVHLWLRDGRFKNWVENLTFVKTLPGLRVIYPGHGEKSDVSLIDEDIKYITDFENAIHSSSNAAEVTKKIEELYPEYKVKRILTLSIKQFFNR